jgi:hypothetical protein
VVDDLVEGRGFGYSPPVVLELILRLFPRVAPEHAGWFGEVRLVGVVKWGRGRKGIQVRFQGGLTRCSVKGAYDWERIRERARQIRENLEEQAA